MEAGEVAIRALRNLYRITTGAASLLASARRRTTREDSMSIRSRVAAVATSVALASAGMLGLASPASAGATALICPSYPQLIEGSGGHKGAKISCTGGSSFFLAIRCETLDAAKYRYWHYGNWAASGGTSTTWCDLNAKVIATEPRTS
ncbi:hypothetical protein [Streptomyces sp. NBC_00893]|uniref:hypothetical protein n=1 Tax=Streptomyces sp. NBC_00893 TaxID=2975862 RepID=UPI002257B07B|nr:hypothetical protein [Streptomyces sp. NBC_00893]MCX4851988.1 hypothetical protein [Streptomyces sp. NBC_00893]